VPFRRLTADALHRIEVFPGNRKEPDLKLLVALDEILPAKEAARALPKAIDKLVSGEAQHLVITRRNKPKAVLVTLARYETLLANQQG
jgi:hypothetical protein